MFYDNNENNILEKLAYKFGTDKSRTKHLYTKWYYHYFSPIRHKKMNVLEIGVIDS